MAEVARMRFKSVSTPTEHGALVLSDDGTLYIEPSDELRDEMARLEEKALHRSKALGFGIGGILIALGSMAIVLGWLAGRIFGKMGTSLSTPRRVEDVQLRRDEGGAIRLAMRGVESPLQTVQMGWNPDEVLETEADDFIAKFNAMKE